MRADNFSLGAYLARIGYQGVPSTDIGSVSELMRRQLFTVPFENLDVQAGKVVSMVPEDIVEKIVERKRGGYCYEVNGLFAMALAAIGVEYQFVAARPMFYPVRRPRTHMAIVASIGGRKWLCDLGFGSYGIRAPIRLDADEEVSQDDDRFSLKQEQAECTGFSELACAWHQKLPHERHAPMRPTESPSGLNASRHPHRTWLRHRSNGRSARSPWPASS